AVFGPIPPGEAKQLSYGYVLPATTPRLAVPIDQPTAEVDLLVEDTTATVTAPQLDTLGVQEIETRRFARYRTRALAAGAAVTIAFAASRDVQAASFVPFVVIVAAAALAVGFVVALRRRPAQPTAFPPCRCEQRVLRCCDHLDRLAIVAHTANGESRKPVRIRRGPATVTGMLVRSTVRPRLNATGCHHSGRRADRPKPGDLSVRATCRSPAG